MTMLDDHNPVGVAMAPALVPAAVAMFAEFGPRAEVMMVAVPDHDVLSTCNRWRRDGNRAKRGKNVSKLLHVVLLG
jgi:DNA-binding response OmpR family regulator